MFEVSGEIEKQEVVKIRDVNQAVLSIAIANFAYAKLQLIWGAKSVDIEKHMNIVPNQVSDSDLIPCDLIQCDNRFQNCPREIQASAASRH